MRFKHRERWLRMRVKRALNRNSIFNRLQLNLNKRIRLQEQGYKHETDNN